jgi:hypothetical protein
MVYLVVGFLSFTAGVVVTELLGQHVTNAVLAELHAVEDRLKHFLTGLAGKL